MLWGALWISAVTATAMAASATCTVKRTTLTSDCEALCPDTPLCARHRATFVLIPTNKELFQNDSRGCYTQCVPTSIEPNQRRILRVRFRGYSDEVTDADRTGEWIEDVAALQLPRNVTGLDIGFTGDEAPSVGFPDGNLVANDTRLEYLGITNIMVQDLPESLFQLPISTLSWKAPSTPLDGLDAFKSIDTLILDGGAITMFPTTQVLVSLPQVLTLSLVDNDITELSTEAASSAVYAQSKLQVLSLGGNRLRTFASVFPSLQTLHLHQNQLTSLPDSLASMPLLRELRLDGNALDNEAIAQQLRNISQPLSAIEVLNLTACGLEDALPASFATVFPNLTYLEVANNTLKRITLTDLPIATLSTLNASFNTLSNLSVSLPRLRVLDLTSNTLQSLAVDSPSLETLLVARNALTRLPATMPLSLVTLNASANALTSFPPVTLATLRVLDLSDTDLTAFPASAVWTMANLRVLHLQGNPKMTRINVTTVQWEILQQLSELKTDPDLLAGTDCPSEWLTTIRNVSVCVLPAVDGAGHGSLSGAIIGNNSTMAPPAGHSGGRRRIVMIVAIAVIAAAVALLGLVACWRYKCRRKRRDHPPQAQYAVATPTHQPIHSSKDVDGGPAAPEPSMAIATDFRNDPQLCKLRIEMEHVRFYKVVGVGAFGQVWQGTYRASTANSQVSFSGSLSHSSSSSSSHNSSRHKTHHVAIKTVASDLVRDQQSMDKFVAESKLQATLSHPRIVEVVGVAWTSLTDLCVLFEYMPGGNLYATLQTRTATRDSPYRSLFQRGAWGESKLQVALDIVDALAYVHALSPPLIHHGLKSRNVLLDAHGRAKLSDFGVASTHETMASGVRWMAPEVVLGSADVDEKADVYSFGVILSELDTHEVPYGREAEAVATSASTEDRTATQGETTGLVDEIVTLGRRPEFLPSCPRAIRELAIRCMAANPSDRPSAVEIDYLLRRVEMDGSDARISLLV